MVLLNSEGGPLPRLGFCGSVDLTSAGWILHAVEGGLANVARESAAAVLSNRCAAPWKRFRDYVKRVNFCWHT